VAEGRSGWAALPDARLAYAIEGRQLHAFIEADRGTEGARFFARKIARYLDLYHSGAWRGGLPVWPLVLTVTLSEPRAHELCRASESVLGVRAENAALTRTFRFAALAQLRGEAGPFAAIWRVAGTDGGARRLRDGVARNDGSTDPPRAA
jgi:protein involved in plasmid replication-relaxation